MKAKKLFFKECHLAGRQYHDVDEVWDELKVGTCLRLERDLDNRYDKDAVAVIYDKEANGEREEYLLGQMILLLKIFEQDLKRFSLRLLHIIDKEGAEVAGHNPARMF